MIIPSALNVLIIGFSLVIFSFLWRMTAAALVDHPIGQAMAAVF